MTNNFYQKNKEKIWFIVLLLYVITLGLATISEIFDLGWFKWL